MCLALFENSFLRVSEGKGGGSIVCGSIVCEKYASIAMGSGVTLAAVLGTTIVSLTFYSFLSVIFAFKQSSLSL